VLVVTKADPAESNTGYAQGGIAAAMGADDSPALHGTDTIQAGDGLCDEAAVRVLVDSAPADIQRLIEWGARFDRNPDGSLALGREAAHSVRRVLHAQDATGREIGRALWEHVCSLRSVEVMKEALVTRLMTAQGACTGARFLTSDGAGTATASRTLLATGGAGYVFRETTNPPVATGDGVAIAYRAGARVADLEFVQFHPTVLDVAGAARFLLTEALRGEGARLVNAAGEAFMTRYHPAGDLAPRDVVARALVTEAERTGGRVFLSLAHLEAAAIRRRFPTVVAVVANAGLDVTRDPIPVGPAAHYMMGGVETDLDGRTSVPGLFAAGEVACTRVHGANRLASNSLLEGLVFGARAGRAMAAPLTAAHLPAPEWRAVPDETSDRSAVVLGPAAIRNLLWRSAGLFRVGAALVEGVRQLDATWLALDPLLRHSEGVAMWRHANIALVGRLIARAALRRLESRGGHFRADFPARDDIHWKIHVSDVMPAGQH
jgi:L-aspartate oxidase